MKFIIFLHKGRANWSGMTFLGSDHVDTQYPLRIIYPAISGKEFEFLGQVLSRLRSEIFFGSEFSSYFGYIDPEKSNFGDG